MATVSTSKGRLKSERGAELIEFALIFPLLLLVMLGIIDFGFTFQKYEVLTNAAREGARLASLPGYSQTDVRMRVCDYLTTGGVSASGCSPFADPGWITVTDGTVAVGGETIAVKEVQVQLAHSYAYIGPIMSLIAGGGPDFQRSTPITVKAVMRTELQGP